MLHFTFESALFGLKPLDCIRFAAWFLSFNQNISLMMKSGKRILWVAAALLAAAGGVSAQSFNAAPRLTCGSSTTMATTQVNLNTGYLPDRSAELAVGNSDN